MIVKSLLGGHPRRAFRLARSWYRLKFPSAPVRLHLGCGQLRLPGFFNVDCNFSSATDFVGDVASLPCPDNSVERIETYHVIEHIPLPAVKVVLAEWKRVLARGGLLVMECPDLDQAVREYLAGNKERLFSVYGRQRFPGDAHHWGYSTAGLKELLEAAGFTKIIFPPAQDYHKESEPCLRVECKKQ